MQQPDLHTAHVLWMQRLRSKLDVAHEQAVRHAEDVAKANCPVDTGTLLRSITHKTVSTPTGPSSEVTAGNEEAYYAGYVEHGDAPGHTPQPFMRPSANWARQNAGREVAEELRRART